MIEADSEAPSSELQEMVRAGVHIGHKKFRRHPKMLPFVYGIRGNTEIIDVTKTIKALGTAASFLKERTSKGATILFVGTRPNLIDLVSGTAKSLGMPYVTSRWIGGTITNFSVMSERLAGFRDLAEREVSGELAERYNKAERLRFQRQLARLEKELGGIRNLVRLPDVLVLSSLRADELAAREAKKKNIPVIALVDTDMDPSLVDYPIPANDDAIASVRYIWEKLAAAVREGKEQAAVRKEKEEDISAKS